MPRPAPRCLIAQFASEAALVEAADKLHTAGAGLFVETYSPHPIAAPAGESKAHSSLIPTIVLASGLLGFFASLALQIYADTRGYPLDIGGRPLNSWPAFIPTAFENGVLAALFGGFFGFLRAAGLPDLAAPQDAGETIGQALRDGYVLAIRCQDATGYRKAQDLLKTLSPASVEVLVE